MSRACDNCGTLFEPRRSAGRPGRFCSPACVHEAYRRIGAEQAGTRFWEKVQRGASCWLWTAAKDGMGYGMYRRTRAHRFSYALAHGPIPDGLCVLHRCDNPSCVRPEHLFLGTRDDNMRDRNAKGRQARGERGGRARLGPAQVREARTRRALGDQIKDIAADLGVAAPTISAICTGRSWRHV